MNPWLGIGGVLAALGLLMGVMKVFQGRVSPELSRKTVHVGMGLVCLAFPWIFSEPWPVVVLAVLAIASLAAVRVVPLLRRAIGSVLGGVERQSLGEYYFPAAVAAVFLMAEGNKLLYVIPVLTLTVADTVGALIGVRYGSARYRTDEGLKSAEGSVAFFTAAFLTCHVPLLLFSPETGRAECLLISLTAGLVVMLLEAISWRGQDNLIIPIGMYFLLSHYLPIGAPALLTRLLLVLGLAVLTVLWRKRTTLSDSAVLAGALSGYAVWAFGGWFWLFPPLLLFLIYIGLPAFPKESRPIQNLHAVTRVMAGGFLWMLLAYILHRDFLEPFFLCMAAHTGNIVTARLRMVRSHYTMGRVLLLSWLAPALLFAALGVVGIFFGKLTANAVLMTPVAVGISILLFVRTWPIENLSTQRVRVWFSETAVAVGASLVGLIRILP